MKVAFICVNYNNFNFTKQFIESIKKFPQEADIIIVDNHSDEIDVAELKKINDEKIDIIFSEANVGYFKGLNLGINTLEIKDYDYIIIGNNDLYFQSNFLDVLKSKKVNDDIFVIAPNIIRPDGIHQNPHIVDKFGFIAKTYRKIYFSNYYVSVILHKTYNLFKSYLKPADRVGNDREFVITMGYGACYVLTRNFFKNFDELDAPNFLMEEEGVLANQVLSKNGKTLYVPDLVVKHNDHSSIGKVNSKKLYGFARDSYKHYIKHLKYVQ